MAFEAIVKSAKQVYRSVTSNDQETRKILHFIVTASSGPPQKYRVVDIGCGYGRHLQQITSSGFDAVGVEANPELVRSNREVGLSCITVEEFAQAEDAYDIMLMSHVIEHFSSRELVGFLDGYLDRLKIGGSLIIATPLLTPYFYDDFDHVKPYHPMGILMVFGTGQAQVQYYSRNKLALEDIWIRRSPLKPPHTRGRYMQGLRARPRQFLEFASAVAFRLSGGLIGQSDGWVGRFRKVS